jgi:hypothetical protein
MIKKSFPIQKPYFYDTKEGIDHFTKILIEENPKKLTEKEKLDIKKLGVDMKKATLNHHLNTLKKFSNEDPSSYPSAQRGKILEIQNLEKDLGLNKKRNLWNETVKTGKIPELTPSEIVKAKEPSAWDVIWSSMSPIERGQWNAEKRKEKIQKQREETEAKKEAAAAKIKERRKAYYSKAWGVELDPKKMHNQDLKNVIRKSVREADEEKLADSKIFQNNINRKKFNKGSTAKTTNGSNGFDPNPNVIPIGPIPHEKPWYEDIEKLKAESQKAEDRFKTTLIDNALDKLEDTGIETILPAPSGVSREPFNLEQILNISKNINHIPVKDRNLVRSRLIASMPRNKI